MDWQDGTHAPVDFALLDFNMPAMDGNELACELRSRGLNCPIAIITANTELQMEDLSPEAAISKILYKPLEKDLLRQLVAEICQTDPHWGAYRKELRLPIDESAQFKITKTEECDSNQEDGHLTLFIKDRSPSGVGAELDNTQEGVTLSVGDSLQDASGQLFSVRWIRHEEGRIKFGMVDLHRYMAYCPFCEEVPSCPLNPVRKNFETPEKLRIHLKNLSPEEFFPFHKGHDHCEFHLKTWPKKES